MKKWAFLLIFAAALVSLEAQDLSKITVASDEWAGFSEQDGSGLYFDVLRAVYGSQGYSLDIKITPFSRSVEMLESGKVDMNVGDFTKDVKNGIFPKYPIDYDDLTVLMPKAKEAQFKGEESLKDKKVAWIVDYGYENYLNVPVKLTETSDRESAIKMLQAGRVDYYIEDTAAIEPALQDMGLSEDDFALVTIKYIKLYVCFVKNDRGATLQAIWDKRIPELIRSGTLETLYKKWDDEEAYLKLKQEL